MFPYTLFFKVQYFEVGFCSPGSSIFSEVPCLDYLILYDLRLEKTLKNPVVLIIKHELTCNSMHKCVTDVINSEKKKTTNQQKTSLLLSHTANSPQDVLIGGDLCSKITFHQRICFLLILEHYKLLGLSSGFFGSFFQKAQPEDYLLKLRFV